MFSQLFNLTNIDLFVISYYCNLFIVIFNEENVTFAIVEEVSYIVCIVAI